MAAGQAIVDGPLVYVVGPGGIMAINALVGKQLYRVDWPEGAAPGAIDPASAASTTSPFGKHGYYRMGGYYGGQGVQYLPQGVVVNRMGAGVCMPMAGAVDHGVLYVTPSPFRLVALVEDRDL